MKKFTLTLVFCLLASSAQADFTLGTSNPPATPLYMNAGSTSGPMLLTVTSDIQDSMLAWQVDLIILPIGGTGGTLTFQDPATGIATNPTSYIFGSNGLGILVTNSGSQLTANDFDLSGGNAYPIANLLQMDFLASSDASGVFGIYAVEGPANTVWTDACDNTQYFTNVPNSTGMVLIGEVVINSAGGSVTVTPEPHSLTQLVMGCVTLGIWRWRRKLR